ncbi:sensor histidine kinase [Sphingorhabdus sp.]|uniref:sensor histidine kinase n=1 Tax=Sphingorhabdus sp. TaxID=1902408 RepID=UPI00359477C7
MSGPNLTQPISGEIDNDGKLLRADEAFLRLNQRAGGVEGGAIAVPAIAKLAKLSLNLQMKLSRAVRVADNEDHLELWIEVHPTLQFAKVSILSWRALPVLNKRNLILTSMPDSIENQMVFDRHGRLISAKGIAAHGLVPSDFGKNGVEVLTNIFENGVPLANLISALSTGVSIKTMQIKRQSDGRAFDVSGDIIDDERQAVFGFRLRFDPLYEKPLSIVEANYGDVAGNLFGKNLAPVLRQPLGRIIANAETIGGELQGPIRENYALYARDIANAARHLSALVDDLGDLEAVERIDFQTARDTIELGDVARRVAGLLALKAADHRIKINTPADDTNVVAIAEFRRTLQIMLNLVNNAIRYSSDGTAITIETETADKYAIVTVSDQGKGIFGADREKVFQKFERLGRSGDGGSGLGLYISRRLACAMGGDLFVTDSEGGGAKFVLRLPNS